MTGVQTCALPIFGIIDTDYTGEVFVALRKMDYNASDLVLPMKVAQLIIREVIDVNVVVVDDLSATVRSDGGFGSTDENVVALKDKELITINGKKMLVPKNTMVESKDGRVFFNGKDVTDACINDVKENDVTSKYNVQSSNIASIGHNNTVILDK